jgi:hypothetical protein
MMDDDRLSPEHELVVNCCGPTYDSDAADRTHELARGVADWDRVLSIARWHHVRPLVHSRLDSTDFGDDSADSQENSTDSQENSTGSEDDATEPQVVPERVRSEFREAYRAVAQLNLLASEQFATLVERFDDAGVDALPFKGLVLAADVYDDPSLREFADIDFVVRKADVPEAMDVLESSDYEWEYDVPRLDDGAVLGGLFTSPLAREYRTIHDGNRFNVEVRWRVGESTTPFAIGFDRLWRNAREAAVCGTDVRVLDPADRLLVLTYHGTKHHWERLKWVCDVAWLVDQREFDWDDLRSRARRYRTERRLLLGLALASKLFRVSLPSAVAERIDSDPHVSILAEQTLTRVFGHTEPSISYFERKRYVGRSHDSATGVVETVGRSVLEPKMHEYRLLPLPGRYHALYYLLRPVRLAWDSLRPSGELR